MDYQIVSVETASLAILKSDPPLLHVNEFGTVISGGWSDGRLVPYTYLTLPSDSIQEFGFIANASKEDRTSKPVPGFPGSGGIFFSEWNSTIRVYGSTNSIDVAIGEATNVMELLNNSNFPQVDDLWPFPWSIDPQVRK